MIGLTVAGHESPRRLTGIIQCDISVGNLMMNEEIGNPSQEAFLIDLDLAYKQGRDEWSGAPSKTGTKVFMAIGALLGDKHSFMHHLESFFWVLFWVCIHYTGPNCPGRVVPEFEEWNDMSITVLAVQKAGTVAHERRFLRMGEVVTPYFQPLVPHLNRLRREVFPNGHAWERENDRLYVDMEHVLRRAMEDPDVE